MLLVILKTTPRFLKEYFNIIIYVGLVVSMSAYWSWGRGLDTRYFHKF